MNVNSQDYTLIAKCLDINSASLTAEAKLLDISMGDSNTVVSANTLCRHLTTVLLSPIYIYYGTRLFWLKPFDM